VGGLEVWLDDVGGEGMVDVRSIVGGRDRVCVQVALRSSRSLRDLVPQMLGGNFRRGVKTVRPLRCPA